MLKRVAKYLLRKRELELQGQARRVASPKVFIWTKLRQGFLAILRRDSR